MQTITSISRPRKLFLALLTAIIALVWNRDFLRPWPLAVMLPMNDISSILAGYYQTPHLFPDSLRWWHGPWIQQGIFAFRPVSAYLYWGECWAGLHWGFLATAWLGYGLLVANCLLGTTLAWRLTRAWPCTLLAAVLLPLERFFNPSQPRIWLAWFPVHQDLLMSAFLLSALLLFDGWLAGGGRRLLVGAWVFFALACLSKEHAYIFPLFAGAAAAFRQPGNRRRSARLAGLGQAGVMLLAVGALWVYRASVILHPRNPTAAPWPQAHAFLMYLYNTPSRYILAREFWLPGLALLLFVIMRLAVRFRLGLYAKTRWGRWVERPFVWLPGMLLILWLYLTWTLGSASTALWYFIDDGFTSGHVADLAYTLVMLYAVFLLWKYRRREDTAATWCFLALSYVPVLGYFGWHYVMPAWFVRVSYDVLIVKLIVSDSGLKALRRSRDTRLPWRSVSDAHVIVPPAPANPVSP